MLMDSRGQNYKRISILSTILWILCEEIQCEINFLHNSENLKDAESVHSGQLSHVASDFLSHFFPKMSKETCLAAPKFYAAEYLEYAVYIGRRFFTSPLAPSFVILHKDTHTIGPSRCRKNSREDQYGAACN